MYINFEKNIQIDSNYNCKNMSMIENEHSVCDWSIHIDVVV